MRLLGAAALAAVIGFACPLADGGVLIGPAMAGECITADQMTQKLIDGTKQPDFKLKAIKVDKADALKMLMDGIATVAGYPPNKDKITAAVVYKPDDLEKYNVYIAFFGADGCKVAGIMLPSTAMTEMLQNISGAHLPLAGQRDV